MRYPEWFKAQVVQAAMVHRLTYAKVARLYGVSDDNIRKLGEGCRLALIA
jgi:transposase-like protein